MTPTGATQAAGTNAIRPFHVNVPEAELAFTGVPPPPTLSAEERQAYDQLAFFYKHDLAYALVPPVPGLTTLAGPVTRTLHRFRHVNQRRPTL